MPAIGHFLYKNSSNITMKRVWIAKVCFSLASVFLTSLAYSQVYFKHKDWEVACDNTGACRAAGYQSAGEQPVSMMIDRMPGAGVGLGIHIKALDREGQTIEGSGELRLVDLKAIPLEFDSRNDGASIYGEPAALLMRALTKSKVNFLTINVEKQRRRVSLEGLNAVLLKIDEVQKRVSTKNAFVAVGANDDANVLAMSPKPKLKVQELPPDDGSAAQLLAVVSKAINTSECNAGNPLLSLTRLSETKLLLVRSPCWMKSHDNYSNGYWLVDQNEPMNLRRIGANLNLVNYRAGQIFGTQFFVENSDECGSHAVFSWNGFEFVQTLLTRSELCRGIIGRAWDLKLIDFEVEALRSAKKTKRVKSATSEVIETEVETSKNAAKAAKKAKKVEMLTNRRAAADAANAALNPENAIKDAAIRASENSKKD